MTLQFASSRLRHLQAEVAEQKQRLRNTVPPPPPTATPPSVDGAWRFPAASTPFPAPRPVTPILTSTPIRRRRSAAPPQPTLPMINEPILVGRRRQRRSRRQRRRPLLTA
ncbi:hypothetical protein RvY_11402 [Ramazzottius varieornatus]|uniref:Uncharacterized protein n=1 Tax=Ramazzottius varieornatus TaxID=947166 RepID=A0A1D1VG08_RAMVA|nr:hypothetical protein RvY_11402 [Ramazzottius varieornatus]